MRKVIAIAIGFMFPVTCFTQIFYKSLCNVSCDKCGPENPMKVEFKVDKSTNTVLRILQDSVVRKLDSCSIVDSKNWTCDENTYYTINGIAYEKNLYKLKNEEFSCYFEKNIFGKFVVRK